RGQTAAMRWKEDAHDYRYFPEPDLPPLEVAEAWLESVRRSLPPLPRARRERLAAHFQLPAADARILSLERSLADYFEATVAAGAGARECANWVLRDLLRWSNASGRPVAEFPVAPAALAELIALV